jgi:hypothetical protein
MYSTNIVFWHVKGASQELQPQATIMPETPSHRFNELASSSTTRQSSLLRFLGVQD